MAKWCLFFVLVLCSFSALAAYDYKNQEIKCDSIQPTTKAWSSIQSNCANELRRQIQMNVNLSFEYLSMAAYFSRDDVYLPGLSEYFIKKGEENRKLCKDSMDYLLMRGERTSGLIQTPDTNKTNWQNGYEALNDALNMEKEVTRITRRVISVCEQYQESQLIKLLADGLETQDKIIRDLVGKISSLSKMMNKSGALGHFLLDNELEGTFKTTEMFPKTCSASKKMCAIVRVVCGEDIVSTEAVNSPTVLWKFPTIPQSCSASKKACAIVRVICGEY